MNAQVPVRAPLHGVFERLSRAFLATSDMFATPGAVSGQRPGLRYAGIGGPIAGFNRLIATREGAL